MLESIFWRKSSGNLYVFTSLLLLASSCITKNSENPPAENINENELCYIKLYKVNNQAKFYIDGEEVKDTGIIYDDETGEQTIILSKYLDKGKHTLTVEVFNGVGIETDMYDTYWDIYFELFLNGSPIDYIHEINTHSRGNYGLV